MFHFWRVIGYCLGVEDQYNLCTGDFEQTRQLCLIIFEKNRYKFQNPQLLAGKEMGDAIVCALGSSPKVLQKYSSNFFDNHQNVELKTFKEKISYYFFDLSLHNLSRFIFLTWLLTKFFNLLLYFYAKFSKTIKKNLQKNYSDENYQFRPLPECPFKTRLNYKSFHEIFS